MSPAAAQPSATVDPRIREVLQKFWGFDTLRPLQHDAIAAGIEQRDSLVVMPTGGGKSLCYQVPPMVAGRLDVVISPLIALMKDQVDALRQNGYPAAAIHSNLSADERQAIREQVRSGALRLLFLTPERLLTERFLDFIDRQGVRTFAVDEAHCVSQWGHDFRKEYRLLSRLKDRFPQASLHCYTATATTRVQQDIVSQLNLREPRIIIGRFDRPNLVYRVLPAADRDGQVLEIVRRHKDEAVIVYCITRKETERLAELLRRNRIRAAAYHAGLDPAQRGHTQEAFAAEEIDVVVATVAFGMGIDRSNVRCVIHAAMPKSIEHYQQETGRAGRDGLEAECVLLYSGGDAMRWEGLITRSAMNANEPEDAAAAQVELLRHMQGLCGTLACRHRALTRYFGQQYEAPNEDGTCGACDVCLGEVEGMAESTTIAQKILSAVYRLGQGFGAGYVAEVLRGAATAQVRQRGHDQLSVYGLLRDIHMQRGEKALTNLVYQLVDLGLLQRRSSDRPTLGLTEDGFAAMRGETEVKLVEPGGGPVRSTSKSKVEWAGVDQRLFEHLRALRKSIALERRVPAYVIFSDNVLREMARAMPTTKAAMSRVPGVGQKKLADLGPAFIEAIESYCREHNIDIPRSDASEDDDDAAPIVRIPKGAAGRLNPVKQKALDLFAEGASVEEVVSATGRAESTIWQYLSEYIEQQKPQRISAWVSDDDYERVLSAAGDLAADRLKPVYETLNGEVPYPVIRTVLSHAAAMADVRGVAAPADSDRTSQAGDG